MSFARAINSSITWTLSTARLWYFRKVSSSRSLSLRATTRLVRSRALISPASSRRSVSTARLFVFCLADLGKKLLGKNRQVRLIETGGSEHVENAVRHHSAREQLAKLLLDTCSTAPSARRRFDQVGAQHGYESDLVV